MASHTLRSLPKDLPRSQRHCKRFVALTSSSHIMKCTQGYIKSIFTDTSAGAFQPKPAGVCARKLDVGSSPLQSSKDPPAICSLVWFVSGFYKHNLSVTSSDRRVRTTVGCSARKKLVWALGALKGAEHRAAFFKEDKTCLRAYAASLERSCVNPSGP